MLTSTDANLLTNRINKAFAAIGVDDNTAMPQSGRNTEMIAWEYHVASHLHRVADGRKKAAAKAAVRAGIMFDHEKDPKPAGVTESVYNGDIVQIGVSVKAGSSRVDHTAFTDDLIKAGVDRDLIERLTFEHTKLSRPPHTFTTALVTVGSNG